MFKKLFNSNIFISKEKRVKLITVLALYSIILQYGYINYMSTTWGYFGSSYTPLAFYWFVLAVLLTTIPVLWLPTKLNRPSTFILWFLYLFTVIPLIVGAIIDARIPVEDKLSISVTYIIGLYLLTITNKIKLVNFKFFRLNSKTFWFLVFIFITFSVLVIFLEYRENLSLVNIFDSEQVYKLRDVNGQIVNKFFFTQHFITILGNAIFPFLFIYGLCFKKKRFLIFAILGQIFLFSIVASKSYVFNLAFIFMGYLILKINIERKIYLLVSGVTFIIFILVFSQTSDFCEGYIQKSLFNVSSIVLTRFIYVSSLFSMYYNVFFEIHPYTYYSHVSGINLIIDYPFNNQMGRVVSDYMVPFKNNANANFILTDGIAALGKTGVIIISLIAGLFFYIIDSISQNFKNIMPHLIFINSSVLLMNVSFFSTLITGGLLINVFILLICPLGFFNKHKK